MAKIIIDDHLQLQVYKTEDFQGLFNAINNSRQHLNPWLVWVAKTTRPEHSLEFIEASMNKLREQEELALGIFYDGTIIGGVGMHEWSHDTKRAQIGYWICKEYEGRGIVTASLRGFINYIFEKIGLNKIEIHFVTANERSGKVAAKLGFKMEGVIRQCSFRNGVAEDLVVTGLLKSEWDSQITE